MEKHKILEALNFLKKKGPCYVELYATKEERTHFKGLIYRNDGTADKKKIELLLKAA